MTIVRITCNNCGAITGESNHADDHGYISFGLWACCGSDPNTAFSVRLVNTATEPYLDEVDDREYVFVRNGAADWNSETLRYDMPGTGRAELYLQSQRIGSAYVWNDEDEPYICLDNHIVYLHDLQKEVF